MSGQEFCSKLFAFLVSSIRWGTHLPSLPVERPVTLLVLSVSSCCSGCWWFTKLLLWIALEIEGLIKPNARSSLTRVSSKQNPIGQGCSWQGPWLACSKFSWPGIPGQLKVPRLKVMWKTVASETLLLADLTGQQSHRQTNCSDAKQAYFSLDVLCAQYAYKLQNHYQVKIHPHQLYPILVQCTEMPMGIIWTNIVHYLKQVAKFKNTVQFGRCQYIQQVTNRTEWLWSKAYFKKHITLYNTKLLASPQNPWGLYRWKTKQNRF